MMYTKATSASSTSSSSFPSTPQSILKKLPNGTGPKKSVIFNENLNIFYESNDCLCWLQQQQQQHQSDSYTSGGHDPPHGHPPHSSHNHTTHLHAHHQHELIHTHDYNEIDQPTLSPPEGYKDKIFNLNYQYHQQQQQLHQQQMQQQFISNPDITHVNQNNPPSPPSAKRKIFLYNNLPIQRDSFDQQQVQQGRMVEEYEEVANEEEEMRRGLRLGGILKGGRLWRSNSSENKKSPEEPDLLKCIETKSVTTNTMRIETNQPMSMPNPSTPIQKISTGTTPLSTSEQIRLAVTLDTKARKINKKQVECSSLVEKLRWLTSLDDDEENLDDLDGSMDYSTWPSRDNKLLLKKDAGTSTSLETEEIKQLNNFKEENELINFIDINRINKIKKQYNDGGGDDYGFSHRPSVKGIKNKFGKTVKEDKMMDESSQYENLNSGGPNGNSAASAAQQLQQPNEIQQPINEISDIVPIPISPPNATPATMPTTPVINNSKPTQGQGQGQSQGQGQGPVSNPEFKTNFQIIRQSFENNATRPYSWSTLPINHQHLQGQQQQQSMGKPGGSQQPQQQQRMNQQQQQQPVPITQHQLNLHLNSQQTGAPNPGYYGTLQSKGNVHAQQQYYEQQQQQQQQQPQQQQPIYGTIRRVPNVIGRPLFLHYTALSVEAHPNKIIYPKPGQGQGQPQPPQQAQQQPQQQQQQQQPHSTPNKLNDTSPTIQQQLASHYYGPPIRYYNQPPAPPVIPSLCNNLSSGSNPSSTAPAPAHAHANNYNIQPVYTHPHVNVLLSCNSNNPNSGNPAEENNLLECRGIPEGRDEADDEYK